MCFYVIVYFCWIYSSADVIDITPLPTPSNNLQLRGINDNNITVGLYNNGNGHEGFICDQESNCTYHQPSSISTYFTDINNNGIVTVYNGNQSPKLYNINTSQYTDIIPNLPNIYQYQVNGLNDDLIVVGRYKPNTDMRNHATVYYNEEAIYFDYEDYENCIGLKINNMGEAVISCGGSPTQSNTYIIVQITTDPLSYTIIQEIDINSIIPYSIESGNIRVISDSRDIYGTYLKDDIEYVFKYNLDDEEFEVLFDDTTIDFHKIYDVNNVGDVAGTYSNKEKGFIWRPTPEEITVEYTPNVFHLISKENKTRLVTSGWIDPLETNVEPGDMVNVEMTVTYRGIGPNGEDIVIEYDGIHTVEGNTIIKN